MLLTSFLAIWLACLALFVQDVARGTPYPPLLVDRPEAARGHPRVAGLLSGFEGIGVAVGERLISVAGRDLAGAGPVEVASAFALAPPRTPISVELERDGQLRSAVIAAPSYRQYWPRALASLTFGITALALLLRGRPSPMVRAFVWTHYAAAIFFACS
ncbi:MAG TPA: hypothetical protein VFT98_08025, partial [Myxococcota bacterium]|nr:hypothetical protein [Myxococcota bacterium]